MDDFKLYLLDASNHGSSLRVKAECSLVGESAWEAVEQGQVDRLRRESLALAASGTRADVDRIGDEVFSTFFTGSVRDRFLRVFPPGKKGLRILVVFPRTTEVDASLHEIAWETVRYDGLPLAQSSLTPLVRYYEQGRPVLDVPVEAPLRILLTAANADPDHLLDLEAEIATVEAAVAELNADRPRVQLTVMPHAKPEEFRQLYRSAHQSCRPFHVWHHCGHGGVRGGTFRLAFETTSDRPNWVPVDGLNRFLSDCGELRLALLSVCHGGSWPGLASHLAALNVPLTVGFSSAVADEASPSFIRTLYTALPSVAVDVAVNQAREELSHDADPAEWTKAILFSRNLVASPLIRPDVGPDQPSPPAQPDKAGSIRGKFEKVGGDVRASTPHGGAIDVEAREVKKNVIFES